MIVSAIRLYGSETWLITKRIEDLLTSFHNRCARTIGKTFIRKTGGDEWVYPSLAETLKQAHLRPLRYYYLLKTRVKNYAETQRYVWHVYDASATTDKVHTLSYVDGKDIICRW